MESTAQDILKESLKKSEKEPVKKVSLPKPIKVKKTIITPKINSLKLKLKNLISSNKDSLKFIKDFVLYSIAYGIPINYMLFGIFGIKFGILTFPAYGVMWYLFKEEVPRIWLRFFPRRR